MIVLITFISSFKTHAAERSKILGEVKSFEPKATKNISRNVQKSLSTKKLLSKLESADS